LDDFNTSTLKFAPSPPPQNPHCALLPVKGNNGRCSWWCTRYLLVPYYLGGALGQMPALAKRAHNLKRAQVRNCSTCRASCGCLCVCVCVCGDVAASHL
jgi:hypothetical protein